MRLSLALLLSLLVVACGSLPDPAPTPVASGTPLWYSIDNKAGLTPEELDGLVQSLDAGLAPVRAAPGAAGAQHLKITITSYRMVQETGRAVVGMVSGTDHVASVLQWIDPAGNRLIEEKRVVTRATKSIGSGPDLARQHGVEIVRVVAGR